MINEMDPEADQMEETSILSPLPMYSNQVLSSTKYVCKLAIPTKYICQSSTYIYKFCTLTKYVTQLWTHMCPTMLWISLTLDTWLSSLDTHMSNHSCNITKVVISQRWNWHLKILLQKPIKKYIFEFSVCLFYKIS